MQVIYLDNITCQLYQNSSKIKIKKIVRKIEKKQVMQIKYQHLYGHVPVAVTESGPHATKLTPAPSSPSD